MKQLSVCIKTVFQISLYLLELVVVSFVITCLTHYFIQPILSYMQLIERMLMSYTVYQILVVVILTNINDIAKDSYLAYVTTLKYCLIYLENRNETVRALLLERIDALIDDRNLNTIDVRQAYEKLKMNIDTVTAVEVNLELVNAEHLFEMATLNWRYSFLLRLPFFK